MADIKSIVQQDAFNDIIGKFPMLTDKILGISFVADIGGEQQVSMYSCKLSIGVKSLSIPIIVFKRNEIDATTFLMDEESNTLLALSPPLIRELSRENGLLNGRASVSNALDQGDIRRLFRAPMVSFGTRYAAAQVFPSIADLASKDDGIALALLKKAKLNPAFKGIIDRVYGENLLKYAEARQKLYTTVIISSKDELSKVASVASKTYREFMMNGFHVDLNNDMQDLDVEPYTRLKDSQEFIRMNQPGFYLLTDEATGAKSELVISAEKDAGIIALNPMFGKYPRHVSEDTMVLGTLRQEGRNSIPAELLQTRIPSLALISNRGLFVFTIREDGRNTSDILFAYTYDVTFMNGDIHFKTICGSKTVTLSASKDIVHSTETRIIVPISNASYDFREDNDQKCLSRIIAFSPVTQLTPTVPEDRISIRHDMGCFYLENKEYPREGLVKELIDRGFKIRAVKILVKTAELNNAVEMKILSGLKTVSDAVVKLSKEVDRISKKIDNQEQVDPRDTYTENDLKEVAPTPLDESYAEQFSDLELPAQTQEYPMPPEEQAMREEQQMQTMSPEEQQMQEQAMAEQQMQEQRQPFQPNGYSPEELQALQQQAGMAQEQGMPQEQEILPQGQGMPQEQGQGTPPQLVNGMNPSIDANILSRIEALAASDSSVMDASVLSTLADEEMLDVIEKYADEVLVGTSAIGKLLLNTLARRYDLEKKRGEANRKKLEMSLRAVFTKMTNLHIDITKSKRSI